jgi:hypothetical protein
MQAKNINSNAMDDTLIFINMVHQIMTELSGAATGQERVIVITKVVLRLLKNKAKNNS